MGSSTDVGCECRCLLLLCATCTNLEAQADRLKPWWGVQDAVTHGVVAAGLAAGPAVRLLCDEFIIYCCGQALFV
jgi:hypothetical protein